MTIIIPANSASADTAYEIDNSCRFNRTDDVVMTDTFTTATNRLKFTISFWMKKSIIAPSGGMSIFGCVGGDTSNFGTIHFNPTDQLVIADASGGPDSINLITTRKFRDPSAWYHIVYAIDSTQGTAANRVKLYVNGTQETVFSTATYPDEDENFHLNRGTKVHQISKFPYGVSHLGFEGYLAEFFFVDGVAHAASTFGEFDEDSPTIWKPKNCKGDLTFGNNGFYLDFADSGDLGDDESGNTNDFAETNLAATDQSQDTPTNNFATLNVTEPVASPASNSASRTYSEGALQVVFPDGSLATAISTIGMSTGKWYFESKVTAGSSGNPRGLVGICYNPHAIDEAGTYMGSAVDPGSIGYYAQNGDVYKADSAVWSGDDYDTGDTIGCALDLDNQEVYFAKNGTWQNSGDPTSGATGTGGVDTDDPADRSGFYFFGVGDPSGVYGLTMSVNFGSPAHAITSSQADDNGYGNFEYDVPAGYLALCTKNLGSDGG